MKVFKAINLCVYGPTNASYWERHLYGAAQIDGTDIA